MTNPRVAICKRICIPFTLRTYIKQSRPCLNFVENTSRRVVFSTLFSLNGNVVKHGLSGVFDICVYIYIYIYIYIYKE